MGLGALSKNPQPERFKNQISKAYSPSFQHFTGSSAGLLTILALLCVVSFAGTAYMALKLKRRGKHADYSQLYEREAKVPDVCD